MTLMMIKLVSELTGFCFKNFIVTNNYLKVEAYFKDLNECIKSITSTNNGEWITSLLINVSYDKGPDNPYINVIDFAKTCEEKEIFELFENVLEFLRSEDGYELYWDQETNKVFENKKEKHISKKTTTTKQTTKKKASKRKDPPSLGNDSSPSTPQKKKRDENFQSATGSPLKKLTPSKQQLDEEHSEVSSEEDSGKSSDESSADIYPKKKQQEVQNTFEKKYPKIAPSFISEAALFICNDLFARGEYYNDYTGPVMISEVQRKLNLPEEDKLKYFDVIKNLVKECISSKRSAVTKLMKSHLRRK
jgi:hypothetical protein